MAAPGRDRRFRTHLTTVGLTNLADGVVATGVPLIAVTLTRSPALIGLLTAAVWLPWLLAGIPAGVLVDRWDRRRTRLVALGFRAAMLAGVATLAFTDSLTVWWLVALSLGYGFTEVFSDLAAQAQVPALVGREASALRTANSQLLATEQVANGFVGPPLAGALVAVGAAWVAGIPALVVVVAIVVLGLGLRGSFAPRRTDAPDSPASLRGDLTEGLRLVSRHRVLRPMLIAAGLFNFASTALTALFVLWMVGPDSAGGLTPQVWSLVLLAMPVGGLIGSVLAGPLASRFPEMRVMVIGWATAALLTFIPLLYPTAWAFAAFLVCVGVCVITGNVIGGSLRPRLVEEHLLGRVQGAARVVAFGAMPLGAVVGGQVAERFGIPTVFVGAVVVMLVSTSIVALRVPQRVVDEHVLAPETAGDPTPPTEPVPAA